MEEIPTKTHNLSPHLPLPARDFFLVAAWLGLITGVVDLLYLGIRKYLFEDYLHLSIDVIWMAPVTTTLSFLLVALMLFFLSKEWKILGTLRIQTLLLGLLGFINLFFMFPRLHNLAIFLLAGGCAIQFSRMAVLHSKHFLGVVRHTIVGTITVIFITCLSVQGWSTVREHRALANLPHISPEAPNILFVVLDTVRAKSLSFHGYEKALTPNIEMFANTGVVFNQAIATSSWTLPSHASMFTGHYPHELSASWKAPLDSTFRTLAELLQSRGYLTAGFIANTYYCGRETGLGRGFIHYDDFNTSLGEFLRSITLGRLLAQNHFIRQFIQYYELPGRKNAETINKDFLRWLSRNPDRPFFAFLNYFDAHHPYLPPEPFAQKFGPKEPRENPWTLLDWSYTAEELTAERQAYEASIAYLDHQIGDLFKELDKSSLLENTLVIVTSDHGESFEEHNLYGHGVALYSPSIHVPLILSFNAHIPVGVRIRDFVSLRDLPATILDLVKLNDGSSVPGHSLARHWKKEKKLSETGTPVLSELKKGINKRPGLPVMKGDMYSLIVEGFHYIKNGDGEEEFYDLLEDPQEIKNLVGSELAKRSLPCFKHQLQHALAWGRRIPQSASSRNHQNTHDTSSLSLFHTLSECQKPITVVQIKE